LRIPSALVVARSNSQGIFVFKITMEKKCNKCGEVKCLDEFNNDKYRKDGKDFKCKTCYKIYRNRNKKKYNQSNKKWRENNREQINESAKEIRENNKKHKNQNISTLEFIKLFHENNKLKKCTKCEDVKSFDEFGNNKKGKNGKNSVCAICRSLIKKEYREKNKGIINLQNKKYNFNNKEYQKNWHSKNQGYSNEYHKLRKKTDSLFRLRCNISGNISKAINKRGYSKKTKTYNILKCEFDFFMNWLNGIASNGYNYKMENLELDHVIPISLAETEDEAYLLNHYSNFQLLTKDENRSKSNRRVNPLNLARVLEHHPNPDKIKEIHARL
jgi:hypothetical protein